MKKTVNNEKKEKTCDLPCTPRQHCPGTGDCAWGCPA